MTQITAPAGFAKNIRTMTLDEVRAVAPAVFGHVASNMSDRYQMVPTHELLGELIDRGYEITNATQEKATKRNPLTVRHMVTLVHQKALANRNFKEGVPTTLLWNSHNGRTRLRMAGGYYRLVCSNGLIVGVTEMEFAFTHMPKPLIQLPQALELVAERQQIALERMAEWQQVELSERKVINFAERAAQLRFGREAGSTYNRDAVLHVRRPEDEGRTLWRVMNRVQENLMRGGVEGKSANGRKVISRPVKNITLDLEFNRGLWQLADEYAKAA